MRIALTYDLQHDSHDPRQTEWDPPRVVAALRQSLEALGHEVVDWGNAGELLHRRPQPQDAELVFNIAEGAHGRNREAWVPILLEMWGLPSVGSDAFALSLGLDKHLTKQLARAEGVPTPPWIMITHPRQLPDTLPLPFPVLVKPRAQGSGIGIDEGAVVHESTALRERIDWLFARWPEPALIETFVPAGELTVCIIGNDPPVAFPPIQRALDPHSRLSCHVVRHAPGPWETPLALTDALEASARQIALRMYHALGCQDVARVDLRVDAAGQPWFLEINPLPSFDPEGSMGLLAESLGLRYPDLIGRVLDAACQRLYRKTVVVR